MSNDIMHIELVTSVLASAKFHSVIGLEQITLQVPIGNNGTHHMMIMINPDTQQVVIDVMRGGSVQYSGICATDMKIPMCPVFKH